MTKLTPQTEENTFDYFDLVELATDIAGFDEEELSMHYDESELTREVVAKEAVNMLKSSGSVMFTNADFENEKFTVIIA